MGGESLHGAAGAVPSLRLAMWHLTSTKFTSEKQKRPTMASSLKPCTLILKINWKRKIKVYTYLVYLGQLVKKSTRQANR